MSSSSRIVLDVDDVDEIQRQKKFAPAGFEAMQKGDHTDSHSPELNRCANPCGPWSQVNSFLFVSIRRPILSFAMPAFCAGRNEEEEAQNGKEEILMKRRCYCPKWISNRW